jgi:hypothetical protein
MTSWTGEMKCTLGQWAHITRAAWRLHSAKFFVPPCGLQALSNSYTMKSKSSTVCDVCRNHLGISAWCLYHSSNCTWNRRTAASRHASPVRDDILASILQQINPKSEFCPYPPYIVLYAEPPSSRRIFGYPSFVAELAWQQLRFAVR